jgi:filamentous hemagglutinin family protein
MENNGLLIFNKPSKKRNVKHEIKIAVNSARFVIASGIFGILSVNSAFALPTGQNIVAGQADIQLSSNGQQMTINQQSDNLVTNWDKFNVGAEERVSFNQPGSNSVALNRVIGAEASSIQGRIDSNGKVFLVNPNGIVFGKTSQVNVGGLIASTQNISDTDFKNDKYRFTGNSQTTVKNLGNITVLNGGSVALLGAQVSNDGVIQAQSGSVALASGKDITLNFDGNNLISLQVNSGTIDALVKNGGLIKAEGGKVFLNSQSIGGVLQSVINTDGKIEAASISKSASVTSGSSSSSSSSSSLSGNNPGNLFIPNQPTGNNIISAGITNGGMSWGSTNSSKNNPVYNQKNTFTSNMNNSYFLR